MLSVSGDEMPSKIAETQMEFVNARAECKHRVVTMEREEKGEPRIS